MTEPQCPEALYYPAVDVLQRCVRGSHRLGEWHRTEGGTEWRNATETEATE